MGISRVGTYRPVAVAVHVQRLASTAPRSDL
jgi:hypothetical protein